MKASWSTREAAPKAAVAFSPKPFTMPMTKTMLTEVSDCCTADGMPMRTVVHVVRQSKPFHPSDGATGLWRLRNHATSAHRANPWAITVAQAVPLRPRAGRPSQPNMSNGSRAVVSRTAAV